MNTVDSLGSSGSGPDRPLVDTLTSDAVVGVEIRTVGGAVDDSLLFDEERAWIGSVAPGRWRDFVLGRRCARLAVSALGIEPAPVRSGGRREPIWQPGVVGAITHTRGYVASAVARATDIRSIGVDAEPDEALPPGVERRIVAPGEMPAGDLGVGAPDRLIFSAKEAVYKAWFPLVGEWLGFLDARLEFDGPSRTFVAHIVAADAPIRSFSGRYRSHDGVIVTTVEVPRLH